ncbi:dTDP-4-dehydrorhamnose 3,5-epimerase [Qipengyuania sediminis]|uniref:dTDP-4-dehydrorhamnose 3,5-epimerase n=1 Tax=Qipengyuania sediminis TaxID=1532023 RepID=UPI001059BAF3|nr:dTDP-4-dehydrorhamnose 3,5-epimerase [Qipengyuania sediminis]
MKVNRFALEGPLEIEPRKFGDARGFFLESWSRRAFAEIGIDQDFVQDNHSRSAKGVLRGLHFQDPMPQGKLVRVSSGRAWDVAVDIRRGSPSFGQWAAVELSAERCNLFWVPPGFAHGFLSLADDTDFLYKCTDYYALEHEGAIRWDDPDLAIAWPLEGIVPQVSAKDERAPSFREWSAGS